MLKKKYFDGWSSWNKAVKERLQNQIFKHWQGYQLRAIDEPSMHERTGWINELAGFVLYYFLQPD